MLSRQHPRHAVELPVTFTGDHNGEGLLTNLSLSGGRIERTDTHIERRAVLTLSLHPFLQESPVNIEVAAVRWTSGPACGVEFLRIGSEAQHRLARYIAGPALIQSWVKYLT
jgi:hypothetical protein